MSHSGSGSGQRTEVAPPRQPAGRSQRNGYILLAVSGVVLATAFGGIAQLVSSSKATGLTGGNDGPGSRQVAPQYTVSSTDTATAGSEGEPASSSASTAVVSIGPDGRQTVTLLSPQGSAKNAETLSAGSPIPPGTTITGTIGLPGGGPSTTRTSSSPSTPPPSSSTATSSASSTTTTPTPPSSHSGASTP